MTKKDVIIVGSILLFALVAAGLFMMPSKPRTPGTPLAITPGNPRTPGTSAAPGVTWTMADGSNMRLLQVTYGSEHVLDSEPRFRDLDSQVTRLVTPYPGSLVLWFEGTGAPANPGTVPLPAGDPGSPAQAQARAQAMMQAQMGRTFLVSFFDEAGIESSPVLASRRQAAAGGSGIYYALLQQYPRRSKSLRVKIADTTGSQRVLAQFQVPNPAPQNAPNWKAESLPAARKTGDLEVTLVSLETIKPPAMPNLPAMSGMRPSTRPKFEIRFKGQPTTEWNITRLVLLNAAGESNQMVAPSGMPNNQAPPVLTLPFPIWTEEPAWKLQVELARTSGFGTGESWTNRGIEIPSSGMSTPLNCPTSLLGEEINLANFATLQFREPPASLPPTAIFPNLTFSVETPDWMWLTVLEVKDDRGQVVRSAGGGMSMPAGRGAGAQTRRRMLSYSAADGARTLDVSMGVSRLYSVEFTVKPVTADAPPVSNIRSGQPAAVAQ